jgi:hypothetical protein
MWYLNLRSRFVLALIIPAALLFAQTPSVKEAVQVSAIVTVSPASITVKWPSFSGATGYTVHRKLKTASTWSQLGTAGGSATQYVDNTPAVGTAYEYKVVRTTSSAGTGYGYIASGIQLPVVDARGKMVLLVDNTFSSSLATQLTQLVNDLRADGWVVLRSDVSRTASASSIRSIIQTYYNADPANVKAVFLFGHVPVPYSGQVSPDSHGDHIGAWPADGYYGEMNGTWTDNSVNITTGQSTRNHNVPGDGKFDQSDYPGSVELQVGRVDLSGMESFQYYLGQSEQTLLSNYLTKLHNFKVKQTTPTFRAAVFDNFEDLGSPIAACGYRTASANVGAANLTDFNPNSTPFGTSMNNQSYLWTYACGGGTWISASNIASTDELCTSVTWGGVFNMMLGSYFGDWDSQNNLLRAVLGRGAGLANCFAGIPNMWFHHMGMGDNIGYSMHASMNNGSAYTPQNCGYGGTTYNRIHMGLLGDPSLRQVMVNMPSNLQITNAGGVANFTWTAATGSPLGYHLYDMGASASAAPVRLTSSLVTGTSWSSASVPFVSGRQYMVRAVKLETGSSGTYYNMSLGALGTSSGQAAPDCLGVAGGSATVGSACSDNNACTTNDVYNASCQCVGTSSPPVATITPGGPTTVCAGGSVMLNASTGSGYSYVWKRNGTTISGATSNSYAAAQSGSYTVVVTRSGCAVTSSATSVTVSTTAVTATISAGGTTTFCTGGSVLLTSSTGAGYSYAWKRNGTAISGGTSSTYSASLAGSYTVTITSGGCSATSSTTTVTVNAPPTATVTAAGSTSICAGGNVVLNANTGTGHSYLWKRNGTTISGATASSYTATQAGSHTVTVTKSGCSTTSSGVNVSVVSGSVTATLTAGGATTFCTGGSVLLSANTGSGLSYTWKRSGTTISGATSSTYAATQSGSYTVTVISGSCSATSTGVNVTVKALPTATLAAAGPTSICSGATVALNAATGSGYTYVWKRSGSTISGATGSSYTASQAGSYTVTISSSGCSATSSAVNVTVGSGSLAAASLQAYGSTVICPGGVVIMATNNFAGLTYSWYRNGTVIAGANMYWYSAIQNGTYTAAISSGGCTSVSNPISVTWCNSGMMLEETADGTEADRSGAESTLDGILPGSEAEESASEASSGELPEPMTLTLYPNPSNGIINLFVSDPGSASVEISDLMGRSVHQQRFAPTMDVSVLPSGAYIVMIRSFDGKPLATGRLVRE